MEQIRVLHIVGAMNRGGTENLIMELYRNTDRSKVQFDFLVYNYSNQPGAFDDEILSLGGKIYQADKRFYRQPFAFFKELKQFLKQHNEYRMVHIHQFAHSGYMARIAKRNFHLKTIVHSHSTYFASNPLRKIISFFNVRFIKKYADFLFGCSTDAIEQRLNIKIDNKRAFVVNNCIDVEKFAFDSEQREKWRRAFGAGDSTRVIGNVARFTREKNHELIIQAFHFIHSDVPDSKLVLIGDGDRKHMMEKLVQEKGLTDSVLFLGVREDVNSIINALDVFLMPSRFEGLGIVLIEAQANGLPCVASELVIPKEADVGAGIVTRVSLEENAQTWAKKCLEVSGRLESEKAQQAVKTAGFTSDKTAAWLQDFYLKNWK
ncbi:MAG: glycosyltransferase [Clostridia bacterium]|nr:glycosyltransferase [Clostridia bacterium]